MSKKKVDFEAFTKAVSKMKLGKGVDSAACHFSAVNVKDWGRIQNELEKYRDTTNQEKIKEGFKDGKK